MEIAILGLGCFWGPEKKFGKIEGIVETEVGYCGGKRPNTNYKEVCTGETEHAEVVKLTFDPKKITFEQIIGYFFEFHDPTTLNKQGPDVGTQYRSVIFTHSENQIEVSKKVIDSLNSTKFNSLIVTQIKDASDYYLAEDYHQKYIQKNNLSSCGG